MVYTSIIHRIVYSRDIINIYNTLELIPYRRKILHSIINQQVARAVYGVSLKDPRIYVYV